jgi:hypothetical protein
MVAIWLDEFEREGMIERYRVEDVEYMRAVNWRKHQRVDRPTQSRLPPSPRETAKAREASRGRDGTAGKALDGNDKRDPAAIARAVENIPRGADGRIAISREWLTEYVAGEMLEAQAEGNRDHVLRSAMMIGRLIGWAGEERPKGRPPAASASASASPSIDSLFSDAQKGIAPVREHPGREHAGIVLPGSGYAGNGPPAAEA